MPSSPFARPVFTARRVARGLYEHHAFDHAATMSFYFFLGLIPLLVLAGSLVGQLVQEQGVDTIAEPLLRLMPPAAAELVGEELRALEGASVTSLAPLSLLGFLILTSNGVHNLMDVFEMVLGAPHRSWWRQRVLAIAWVIVSLITIALAAWAVYLLDKIVHGNVDPGTTLLHALFVRMQRAFAGTWQRLGVISVFFGIASIALAGFYRISVQHPREVRRRVWPGSFAALVCWVLVSFLFGEYVRTIGHYAVYFGSLAAVAMLLFWLYLTSLALLLGAEVNAVLEGIRDLPATAKRPAPPGLGRSRRPSAGADGHRGCIDR